MRLSMYILAEWLDAYHPVCSIKSGNRTIRNVRMFSDDLVILANNVYVGRTSGNTGKVMCIHENDYMILECDDEIQIMNEIMDAFDFYNSWSDQLNRQMQDLSLDEILNASKTVLQGGLLVTDASYYILAELLTPELKKDPLLQSISDTRIMDLQHIMKVEQDEQIRMHSSHAYIQKTGEFTQEACVRNLFANQLHWGWLISIDGAHTRAQMDIVDELGDILEVWMRYHPDLLQYTEQSSVFLTLLGDEHIDEEQINLRLRLIHWNFELPNYIYYVEPEEMAYALVRKLRQLSDSVYTCVYQKHLLIILQGDAAFKTNFERNVFRQLNYKSFHCGVSPAFHNIHQMKQMLQLAQIAAQYQDSTIQNFQDIALSYSLELLQSQCGEWLTHPAVKTLREYDAQYHTEFSDTLYQYLCCERSLARLCRQTGLHRNTLLYRIERIQEIIGVDLDDTDLRLHLLLSYRLTF